MTTPPVPKVFQKAIGAYLKEANALQAHDPLMAFYCRFYAMQQGIPLMSKGTKEDERFLESLMIRLESDKRALEAQHKDLTDSKYATKFALRVFAVADKEDRAGKASANTARTFLAASAFFDVLQQFAPLPDELVQLRKYCKFKAASILKAIRDGRTPEIGGPMSAEEIELNALMELDAKAVPQDDPNDSRNSNSGGGGSGIGLSTNVNAQTSSSSSSSSSSRSALSPRTTNSAQQATPPSHDDTDALAALIGNLPSVPSVSSSTSQSQLHHASSSAVGGHGAPSTHDSHVKPPTTTSTSPDPWRTLSDDIELPSPPSLSTINRAEPHHSNRITHSTSITTTTPSSTTSASHGVVEPPSAPPPPYPSHSAQSELVAMRAQLMPL